MKWAQFAKKVHEDGKKTNPNYQFKDALKDASVLWKSEKANNIAVESSSEIKPTKAKKPKKVRGKKTRKSKK